MQRRGFIGALIGGMAAAVGFTALPKNSPADDGRLWGDFTADEWANAGPFGATINWSDPRNITPSRFNAVVRHHRIRCEYEDGELVSVIELE